jgi:hypothetical protein
MSAPGRHSKSIVLIGDLAQQPEDAMEFRLTYAGPLFATQKEPLGNQNDLRCSPYCPRS